MTDYSKMKNAELETLLKDRKLPHTGKKAEMVARLHEADKATPSAETSQPAESSKPATTTAAAEDEIDWDEDDAADTTKPADTTAAAEIKPADATTEPAAATMAAGGKGQVANPVAVPNQVTDVDPSTTHDLAVKPPPGSSEPTTTSNAPSEPKEADKPAVDFSSGIAQTTLEEELEKRRARAKKFGISDEESEKMLERAKKFGTDTSGPAGLNEALPERRKRGREAGDEGQAGRGGKRGRRGRGGRPGNERRDSSSKVQKPAQSGGWMSEADKAKAEARKARFATAAGEGA
ncbi:hypothetical protein K490DRAFT_60078 [Saccharata proteae CBS 121410]|uniref:SAP domain-containing protein n=1 Tax=Saccharata proteae CBS 121410 TaxID=1314787 RepID=A0A9P4LTK9_9PEZI|nr:hypothetical protein K490DRAFT_60078 [Saccharata proteae CBS 121410]